MMSWAPSFLTVGSKRFFVAGAFFLLTLVTLHHQSNFDSDYQGSQDKSAANRDAHLANSVSPPTVLQTQAWTGHAAVEWGQHGAIPQTLMLKHQPGFTIFDNIYMANTTYFIVTDTPASFPPIDEIINSGVTVEHSDEERDPTDKDMQIISTKRARELFGTKAIRVEGVTLSTNEPSQFIVHYYHFVGEIMIGLWRLYSTLDLHISPSGKTSLAPVRRWLFPHVPKGQWRDKARMNQFVLGAAFPNAPIWGQEEWQDLADTNRASVFDRLVLTERGCVERKSDHWREGGKFASIAFRPTASPNWWVPVRNNVWDYSGVPMIDGGFVPPTKPVITYISRQGTGRRLITEDHERLVKALRKMETDYGYQVNIPQMERLNRAEQIQLMSNTTILMGVHGNGLTHMLWMPSNPRAAVFEFYFPGGYAADYAWPAQALGFTHYGFWNDTHFSQPDVPKWEQPEGFHGDNIPLDGDAVVKLCIQILST